MRAELSQPTVTIADKRNFRHALRLLGEAGGSPWLRLGCETNMIPPKTAARFPNSLELLVPDVLVSVGITEPSDEQPGAWTLAFDRYMLTGDTKLPAIAWRVGYVLLGTSEPEELTLYVNSYGTAVSTHPTDDWPDTMNQMADALESPTNLVTLPEGRAVTPPLEAPEIRILAGHFAAEVLQLCRDTLWGN